MPRESMDGGTAAVEGIAARLRGAVCAAVAHYGGAGTWTFGFGGGIALELFNDSAGFEDCEISAAGGFQVVAMGGRPTRHLG